MRNFLILVVLILLIAFSINYKNRNLLKIEIKDKTVYASIADNNFEMMKGLMNVKKLGENKGMLFVYKEETASSFWMKNTLIPLDMLWINENKEIVHIKHNAQPCKTVTCPSYKTPVRAKYVLEVNGNYAESNNIKIGDTVKFEL